MVVLGIEGIFGQAAKAAMSGKRRVQWDTDSERKLIEIWADILGRYNGFHSGCHPKPSFHPKTGEKHDEINDRVANNRITEKRAILPLQPSLTVCN